MRFAAIVLRRGVAVLPTALLASLVVFLLLRLIPGGVAQAIAGEYATAERLAEIRRNMGLDRPLLVQYLDWVRGVLGGDLGESLYTGQPVASLIAERLPITLLIGGAAIVLGLAFGVPAALHAASNRGKRADRLITSVATLGIGVPNFWLGMMLILVVALWLGWLPATGSASVTADPLGAIRSSILPAATLGAIAAAEVCRQLRSAMVEVLGSEYIRTHHAKGLSPFAVTWKHALKNASLPLVTIVGLQVSHVLGATVVVETVFGIHGVGNLVVTGIEQRDYPVIQGVVLVMAVLVLVTNLLVDVSYRLLDPRIS